MSPYRNITNEFYYKGAANKLAGWMRRFAKFCLHLPCVNIRQALHSTDWRVKVTASHQMLHVTYGEKKKEQQRRR